MSVITVIVFAAACFLAAILNLTAGNRLRNRILSVCFAASLTVGLILYGYGYAYVSGTGSVAVLRTLLAVFRMITGDADLESIEDTPLFENQWVVIVFWAARFLAFYAVAGTAVAAFGDNVLRRLRVWLFRRRTLLLIFGISEEAVEYGRRQSEVWHRTVVYVGACEEALESEIYAVGGVLEKNGAQPSRAMLRRLGIRPGKRRIEIAALHEDGVENLAFAQKLQESLKAAGILSEQTLLLIREADEEKAGALIAAGDRYGYGSVMAYCGYELAARLMVQELPPCETIRFDENARATDDFGVLIVGFGKMGRAVLNAVVMNGQFCGSDFRADIFDEDAQNGALYDHEMFRQYDIRFHEANAKSNELYALLSERKESIRYIVLCTGSIKENREIAQDISRWMWERGAEPAVVQCTGQGLVFLRPGKRDEEYLNIYESDVLNVEHIDRMAMVMNHAYSRHNGKTAAENWKNCDYFSRMSSRASADFYQALLKAGGKTVEQVLDGQWQPKGAMLENLSVTEHLRWCAFHYVMGFCAMTEAEFAQRADIYREQMRIKGSASIRLSKDMEKRKHACLIPWEELDALSAKESAVTGKPVDYKQMDRNNVLALPDILKILHETK